MTTVDSSGAIHGTDGKFAGHVAGEPDDSVALVEHCVEEPDQKLMHRAADNARRVFDLGNAGWAMQRQAHAKAALACAEYVRTNYPAAAKVSFRDGRDYADNRWHPHRVTAADGQVLEADLWDHEIYESMEAVSGSLEYREASLSPHFKGSVEGETRVMTMDIDGVLNEHGDSMNPETAARRANTFVSAYTAAHGDMSDQQTTVQDMLTDLHHWARANDVDLAEAMDKARWMADEEQQGELK